MIHEAGKWASAWASGRTVSSAAFTQEGKSAETATQPQGMQSRQDTGKHGGPLPQKVNMDHRKVIYLTKNQVISQQGRRQTVTVL